MSVSHVTEVVRLLENRLIVGVPANSATEILNANTNRGTNAAPFAFVLSVTAA